MCRPFLRLFVSYDRVELTTIQCHSLTNLCLWAIRQCNRGLHFLVFCPSLRKGLSRSSTHFYASIVFFLFFFVFCLSDLCFQDCVDVCSIFFLVEGHPFVLRVGMLWAYDTLDELLLALQGRASRALWSGAATSLRLGQHEYLSFSVSVGLLSELATTVPPRLLVSR